MKKLLVTTACLAADLSPVSRLSHSCQQLGLDFEAYGVGTGFSSWKQAKMDMLTGFLETKVGEYEYCLFTDGFDSWMMQGEKEILKQFKKFTKKIVIAGERNCYPSIERKTVFPESPTSFRYPCAGQFIGKTADILEALKVMTAYYWLGGNDQGYWHEGMLDGKVDVEVDYTNKLFLSYCGLGLEDLHITIDNKLIYVRETKKAPCAIHFNGPKTGNQQGQDMNFLWEKIYGRN